MAESAFSDKTVLFERGVQFHQQVLGQARGAHRKLLQGIDLSMVSWRSASSFVSQVRQELRQWRTGATATGHDTFWSRRQEAERRINPNL
jgi:hypothetical protein